MISNALLSGAGSGTSISVQMQNMRNPVAVNTPSNSYSFRTATPDTYGLDSISTGLTITSTEPGNVTINSFIPRFNSEITEIYPG